MAQHFYAMELGDAPGDITSGSSTQTKTAEVSIELSDGSNRAEVVNMIRTLASHIEQGQWPPA